VQHYFSFYREHPVVFTENILLFLQRTSCCFYREHPVVFTNLKTDCYFSIKHNFAVLFRKMTCFSLSDHRQAIITNHITSLICTALQLIFGIFVTMA